MFGSRSRGRYYPPQAAAVQRTVTALHTLLYCLSAGRLGGFLGKHPVLLLTTIGRKTRQPRTQPLFFLRDGQRLVIVASNGGTAGQPSWYINIEAYPWALVTVGRQQWVVEAQLVDADEKRLLWPRLVALYGGYAVYQRRTERDIPLLGLLPRSWAAVPCRLPARG